MIWIILAFIAGGMVGFAACALLVIRARDDEPWHADKKYRGL
jgi:uncharacterized protein involved in exopolysaccharide biosynthesis